jgi:glycosyltransferase involved in cell wall biosynthesis
MSIVAVLLPCYNEEKTIEKVILDFKNALPEVIVYVYDNNSRDNSAEIAKKAGAIVISEFRQGKGNVIRSMFRDIEADCYVMADADDTYPAKHAPEMVSLILEKKADMVIGDRLSSTYFTENKRKFHNTGNVLVRSLINRLFGGDVKDIMTGYRAFDRQFVKTFPVLSSGFEIETEMTIHALDKRFLMREVVVEYNDRPEGSESKLNTVRDGIRVLKTIFRLFKDYRPFAFFGLFSILFFLLGSAFFAIPLYEFVTTGFVLKIPTLIVSGFMILVSMLSLVCGLILDSLRKQHLQNYELLLNLFKQH